MRVKCSQTFTGEIKLWKLVQVLKRMFSDAFSGKGYQMSLTSITLNTVRFNFSIVQNIY